MEAYRTNVFMNRVLRKIFSPKWEEMTLGWRKLCIEFHDIRFSPDLVKKGVMGGACCRHGRVLVENSKETAWKAQTYI
jgi:hypothetical protein